MIDKYISAISHIYTRIIRKLIKRAVINIQLTEPQVWGDPSRVRLAKSAYMLNTLFNTSSGDIIIGENTFTGHGVSLITGTHNIKSLMADRMKDYPESGRDIIIGEGVWIGTNATVLGPCVIEDHSVIAAGSIVIPNTIVTKETLFAGVPAKKIRDLR